jgi:hypothetical protein
MRHLALLLILLVLAACTAGQSPDDSPPPTTEPGDEWTLVVADDAAVDGPGISVAEALTHGPTDDMVLVTGALFIDADGTVQLCDAIAESFPPQCGGERLAVTGLDPADVPDLQDANGVRWAEGVTLFGSVE